MARSEERARILANFTPEEAGFLFDRSPDPAPWYPEDCAGCGGELDDLEARLMGWHGPCWEEALAEERYRRAKERAQERESEAEPRIYP